MNGSVGSNPTPSAILIFRDFPRRPTTEAESDMQHGIGFRAERPEDFPRRRDGGHVRRKDREEAGPFSGTWKRSRIAGDFPKSGRPSVRQSRREALWSRGTNRPKRFPNATRLKPRPPDPLPVFFRQIPTRKNQV